MWVVVWSASQSGARDQAVRLFTQAGHFTSRHARSDVRVRRATRADVARWRALRAQEDTLRAQIAEAKTAVSADQPAMF